MTQINATDAAISYLVQRVEQEKERADSYRYLCDQMAEELEMRGSAADRMWAAIDRIGSTVGWCLILFAPAWLIIRSFI